MEIDWLLFYYFLLFFICCLFQFFLVLRSHSSSVDEKGALIFMTSIGLVFFKRVGRTIYPPPYHPGSRLSLYPPPSTMGSYLFIDIFLFFLEHVPFYKGADKSAKHNGETGRRRATGSLSIPVAPLYYFLDFFFIFKTTRKKKLTNQLFCVHHHHRNSRKSLSASSKHQLLHPVSDSSDHFPVLSVQLKKKK